MVFSRSSPEQLVVQSLLKEIRIASGIKQADLMNKAGLNQSMVSKYESGERRLDIIELRIVCHALGTTLEDFVRRLEEEISKKEIHSNEA